MTMLKGLGHKSCFEMAEEGCVHMLLHLKIRRSSDLSHHCQGHTKGCRTQ